MSSFTQCTKQLRFLDLSHNILTNHVAELLSSVPPSLHWLHLDDCQLTKADVANLGLAVQGTNLRWLDLSRNTLTGCVTQLLNSVPPSLHNLRVEDCQLSAADDDCLDEAKRSGRLSQDDHVAEEWEKDMWYL